MSNEDRVVIHQDNRPLADLDIMFTKARAAVTLGQQFTLEVDDRVIRLTVTTDRRKLAERHYGEQLRLATEEENRAGLLRARDALRSVGDPNPDVTIGFVGAGVAYDEAMSAHLVKGLVDMGLREPVAQVLDDMESRMNRGDVL